MDAHSERHSNPAESGPTDRAGYRSADFKSESFVGQQAVGGVCRVLILSFSCRIWKPCLLPQGVTLSEPGDEITEVFFPHDGMLSLLAVMRDGKAIETATVGREGVVGAMAGLGLYTSMVRVVVQLPMSATKIAAARFRKVVQRSDVNSGSLCQLQ